MEKFERIPSHHFLQFFFVLFLLVSIPLTVLLSLTSRDQRSRADHTDFTPNDSDYLKQWNLRKIQADKVWPITVGSSSIKVAVISAGVDATHTDLDANLVPGRNIVASNTSTDDDWAWGGIGSWSAGVIGAETNTNSTASSSPGVAGINWHVSLMPVKVCTWQFCDVAHTAQGIRWAADNGAHIIDLGVFFNQGTTELASAVDYALGKGVLVVAPTGSSISFVSYPGAYPSVITVGALDESDRLYTTPQSTLLDLVAPGQGIYSTAANGSYGPNSGTFMASAHVSGVLALLLSENVPANIAQQAVFEGAFDMGTAGKDNLYGYGKLDACGAFQRASVLLNRADLACQGGDISSPTVVLTSPSSGLTHSGTVNVTATASDNVGVTKVEFFVGGPIYTKIGEDTTSPYSLSWDTRNSPNGNFAELFAKASDAAGNYAKSTPPIWGTINNVTDNVRPSTPTNVHILSMSNGLEIFWNPSTDDVAVTGYDVLKNGTTKVNPSNITSTNYFYSTASFTDSYTVIARDAAGNLSPPSSPAAVPIACTKVDVNDNGNIDNTDALAIIQHFGTNPGEPNYSTTYDIDSSVGIDLQDVLLALQFFGQICS